MPYPIHIAPSSLRVNENWQVDHAQEIYKRMADNGVVVRFRGNELHCKDCLRVTVGTVEENNRMLELLEETVGAVSAA